MGSRPPPARAAGRSRPPVGAAAVVARRPSVAARASPPSDDDSPPARHRHGRGGVGGGRIHRAPAARRHGGWRWASSVVGPSRGCGVGEPEVGGRGRRAVKVVGRGARGGGCGGLHFWAGGTRGAAPGRAVYVMGGGGGGSGGVTVTAPLCRVPGSVSPSAYVDTAPFPHRHGGPAAIGTSPRGWGRGSGGGCQAAPSSRWGVCGGVARTANGW